VLPGGKRHLGGCAADGERKRPSGPTCAGAPPARGAIASLRPPRRRHLEREGEKRRGWGERRRRRRRSLTVTALLSPGAVSRSVGRLREGERRVREMRKESGRRSWSVDIYWVCQILKRSERS